MPGIFPSKPFPALPLDPPQAGSCHRIVIKLPIGELTIANLFCASTCGPVQVSVRQKKSTEVYHFRPESMVYHPLNRATAGHVVIPIDPPADLTFTVGVTFLNNSESDGEASLFVAVDHVDLDKQMVLAERRGVPPGGATAFHLVFVNQTLP